MERRWYISDFVVITVPADDLAPDGARSSAGTVMTDDVRGTSGPVYKWDQHLKD